MQAVQKYYVCVFGFVLDAGVPKPVVAGAELAKVKPADENTPADYKPVEVNVLGTAKTRNVHVKHITSVTVASPADIITASQRAQQQFAKTAQVLDNITIDDVFAVYHNQMPKNIFIVPEFKPGAVEPGAQLIKDNVNNTQLPPPPPSQNPPEHTPQIQLQKSSSDIVKEVVRA